MKNRGKNSKNIKFVYLSIDKQFWKIQAIFYNLKTEFFNYFPRTQIRHFQSITVQKYTYTKIVINSREWVVSLRWVEESWVSSGISPPDVGELSRRFEGAMAYYQGGVSIVDTIVNCSWSTTETPPLIMKAIAHSKRRDNSPSSGGDIPKDALDSWREILSL